MEDKETIIKKHSDLINELFKINNNKNLMTVQECMVMIQRKETIEMEIKQLEAIESTWNVQSDEPASLDLKLLSSEEVGELLNVPTIRIHEFREIGMLQPIKIGKSYMYTHNDIYHFQETYKGMDISNKRKALIAHHEVTNHHL